MQLETESVKGALIVRVLVDRIDAACAAQFKDQMRALTNGAPVRIVLDLGRVTFIDSSGLGAVVGALKAAAPARLELVGLSGNVARLFELTRMDSVFTIHPDLAAATDPARAAG